MKKTWMRIAFLALLIMCFTGCAKKDKSKRPVMNIDFGQDENGNSYQIMNGSKQYMFQVKEGSYYDVKINVTKEKGTLDATIRRDGEEDNIYTGNDIPTSEFTVRADQTGDYTVIFTAKDFVGDFSCSLYSSDGSSVIE